VPETVTPGAPVNDPLVPSPICSVPAVTAVAPVKVSAPVKVVVPAPLWVKASVPVPLVSAPLSVVATAEFTMIVPVALEPLLMLLARLPPATLTTESVAPAPTLTAVFAPKKPAAVAVPIWRMPLLTVVAPLKLLPALVRTVVPVPLWIRARVPVPSVSAPESVFERVELMSSVPVPVAPLVMSLARRLPCTLTRVSVPLLVAVPMLIVPPPIEPAAAVVPICTVPLVMFVPPV